VKKAALSCIALAAIAALIVLATYTGPGGSPAAATRDDYPLAVGLKWTYRSVGNVAVVRAIDRTVEIDGRRYFEMKYALPILGTRTIPMRPTTNGVATSREGREFLLLRFPMTPGTAWTIDLPGEKEIADCTVVGEEEMEFLGRKGRAVKTEVRRRSRGSDRTSIDYEWYAKGVGLVKMQVTLGLQATFVLESFENSAQVPDRR
jgi:hypothetical protein